LEENKKFKNNHYKSYLISFSLLKNLENPGVETIIENYGLIVCISRVKRFDFVYHFDYPYGIETY